VASAAFLADTNVISELVRPRPNPGIEAWARQTNRLALSVVTVEEVFYGLARRPHIRVQRWFDQFVRQHCEILDVNREIAALAGDIRGRLARGGAVRSQSDMLIAATASYHDLTLVTRNSRDFEGCGIRVLDPSS